MEADHDEDYQEYLNEFRFLHDDGALDDAEEGEQEAEWLVAAGLSQLAAAFREGRELRDDQLDPALRALQLAPHHAEAVRRRVRTLNRTVRRRNARQPRGRARKPDIRDVFRDVENSSTGTRSRSATPDSLDSDLPTDEAEGSTNEVWSQTPGHIFLPRAGHHDWNGLSRSPPKFFYGASPPLRNHHKDMVHRQPSTPFSGSSLDIFSHPGAWRGSKGSLASDNEGIKMLNYQMIGTMHLPRPRERIRSGSDPTVPDDHNNNIDSNNRHYLSPNKLKGNGYIPVADRIKTKNGHVSVARSHSNLYNIDTTSENELRMSNQRNHVKGHIRRSGSIGQLGFEEICLQSQSKRQQYPNGLPKGKVPAGRTWIEFLGEDDMLRLRPLLLLEVTALLDAYNITFTKRKTPKKKRKEEGNVFGVSLAALLEKDHQIIGEDCKVPLIFQKLLAQLERRGLREEGLLRVPGLQQRVDALLAGLEAEFYRQPEAAEARISGAGPHELAAVLKKLLRELPQPLLTAELTDMFYQVHALPTSELRQRALNLLVLLLPSECRYTLRALFSFLLQIIHHQSENKMTLHNVAMIIAPSLFHPRYVQPADKSDLTAHVNIAAMCCHLTEEMLQCGNDLWVVPEDLVAQIRRLNEEERYLKGHKENSKPMKKLLGRKGPAREPITRKIDNEVDFQDGVIRVNAPQFQLNEIRVQLTDATTAGDVVLRIVEEASKRSDVPMTGIKMPRKPQSRALAELAPNGNLSCMLATGYPEITLQTHYLYEIGGNIAQRRLEHSANLLAVYKDNPNARWTLRCDHRNANNET
ncbi:rho GTPase-activating protein conundrum [Schistocerca cancellata]|uniref:rho GTPase-activating protein conundrum n=1 Tax=Schistocerca cancellata TaxID=274614 RepID=UPI0021188B31|nr:rho GTPase-activating protein conundrum [Schistocerca cancellata]